MRQFIKKHKKLTVTAVILTVLIYAFGIYVSDFYRADATAINALSNAICINGDYAFIPEKPKAGFIFYPGGKVECEAYAPLLNALYNEGYLCVIARMPFNLAVFRTDAADSIMDSFPEIRDWYIGGHSLGGSMAAVYAEGHTEKVKGVILFAAYSTADLSDKNIDILSIYGSNDQIMNINNYRKYFSNLPDNLQEAVLNGANHSQFGSYGLQVKDGYPDISSEDQIRMTIQLIKEFIK